MTIVRCTPSIWPNNPVTYSSNENVLLCSNISNPTGVSINNNITTTSAGTQIFQALVLCEYKNTNNDGAYQIINNYNANYEFRIMCGDYAQIRLEDETDQELLTINSPSSQNQPSGVVVESVNTDKYLITVTNPLVLNCYYLVFYSPYDGTTTNPSNTRPTLFYGSEFYIEYDDEPLDPCITYMNNSTIHLDETDTKILKTKGTIVENNINLINDTYNTIYKDDFYNYYTMSSIPFPKTPTNGDIYAGRAMAETWHQWTGADL